MYIGIDLGGTKVAGARVKKGKIVERVKHYTEHEKGKAHVLRQIQRVIDDLTVLGVKGVGIGVPGYFKGTKLLALPNLALLNGVDLGKVLTVPGKLVLGNDAKVFALAEYEYGRGKGTENLVAVTLGTGLGTGVILDGKLWTGRRDRAPELGHTLFDLDMKKFHEGMGKGDWESVLSGPAIVARHKARGGKEEFASDIWASKSPKCRATRAEITRYLAIFCVNIVRTFDPELIVIGGGVANGTMVREANARMKDYDCRAILKLSSMREAAAEIGAAEFASQ